MIIFYDPDTLTPGHVIYQAEQTFLDHHKSLNGNWIEAKETIPLASLGLRRGADGVVVPYRKSAFTISPPATLAVNVESQFLNVPAGTLISVNGASLVRMDGSGVLDFTPTNAGDYTFKFEGQSYMPWEITLEAIPPS